MRYTKEEKERGKKKQKKTKRKSLLFSSICELDLFNNILYTYVCKKIFAYNVVL